jgi:hypothetical protein
MNKEASIISTERIERAMQLRYAPFPELTMDLLSRQLNAFRVGNLREAARIWEVMMERDGDLSTPANKLFSDIGRLPWEVETVDDSREAERHAAALRYFYNNLTATSALEGDETGGINLLLRQMMTAHAYRYSVHEMVWQVNSAAQREVTATFIHCPVWFFESRRGRLAYLPQEGAWDGDLLKTGEWLAAVGNGVMRPCSVAYLTKWQPLAYWGLYCYRFGIPGIHGKTDAAKGSQEWNDFVEALGSFANDWVTLTNRSGEINLVEASKGGSGTLPFQELVERSDRLYARCFRGGDLSTQSRAGGDVAGSNPQAGEKRIILADGAQWATDILNTRVDEPLIAYLFGVEPKAWLRIMPVSGSDEDAKLQFSRDVYKNMSSHAVVSAVMANLTDLKELTEEAGLPVNEDYVDPYVPVRDQSGALVSGEVIKDPEGDVIGALPVEGTGNQTRTDTDNTRTDTGDQPRRTQGDKPDGTQVEPSEGKEPAEETGPEAVANESDQVRVAAAVADILGPIIAAYDERLQRILTITDPVLRKQRWDELAAEMASVEKDYLSDPAKLQAELERINAKALVAGLGKTALGNYDPDQPRDEIGQWTDGASVDLHHGTQSDTTDPTGIVFWSEDRAVAESYAKGGRSVGGDVAASGGHKVISKRFTPQKPLDFRDVNEDEWWNVKERLVEAGVDRDYLDSAFDSYDDSTRVGPPQLLDPNWSPDAPGLAKKLKEAGFDSVRITEDGKPAWITF